METRKMNVKILLSTEGQKDAIRRGLPAMESQELTGEVDISYLDEKFTTIMENGTVLIESSIYNKMDIHPETAQAAADKIKAEIEADKAVAAANKAAAAAEKRKREDKMRAAIAEKGLEAGLDPYYEGDFSHFKNDIPDDLLPAVKQEAKRLEAEQKKRQEQFQKQKEALEAELATAEKARDEHVLKYIREHGTDLQRERLEAEMLPIREAYDACRDGAFSAYSDFERYQKMTDNEIWDLYEYQEIDFLVVDCETATDEQWQAMKALKEIDKSATVTLRRHVAQIDGKEAAKRYGILVKLQSGPVNFSREFAC